MIDNVFENIVLLLIFLVLLVGLESVVSKERKMIELLTKIHENTLCCTK
jgi:hypothetical protein